MTECKYCGKPFQKIYGSQAYCSQECRAIVNRERSRGNWKKNHKPKEVEKVCAYCGKTFLQIGHARKYCTNECSKMMELSQAKEVKSEKRKKLPKKDALRNIVKEARESGMTYGQYVARMEMAKRG